MPATAATSLRIARLALTNTDAPSPMSSTLVLAPPGTERATLVGHLARAGIAVFEGDPGDRDVPSLIGNARLVIAQVDLASADAPDLLAALSAGPQPPAIMVLTPDVPLAAKLHAYDAGADDIVVVPCSLHEVVARARALLRRVAPHLDDRAAAHDVERAAEARIALGAAVLDVTARAIVRDGRAHNVRPKEYALLHALIRRNGEIASREELLADVWGYANGVTTRTVDTHVVRLRRLIERVPSRPEVLLTVAKLGYRLVLPGGRKAG